MFCAEALLHDTSFDPKSSPARNMALTTSIPLSTKKNDLFLYLLHMQSQKGKNK
jgi:hypothetical protein